MGSYKKAFADVWLTLVSGAAIEESLKHLAERRTDIFGVGDEETAIGKKIGEEDVRKDDKVSGWTIECHNWGNKSLFV